MKNINTEANTEALSQPIAKDEPVAWVVWMEFDRGEFKPTDPVLFSEDEAKRQQARYGGVIVELFTRPQPQEPPTT